jgi:CubicO group peptidase (beta-lactamase class C family)
MRMLRALALLTLATAPLSAQLVTATSGTANGVAYGRLQNLTTTIDQYVATGALVGGELLVLRHGKTIYQYAFGMRDRETNDSMRIDDIYRIASQSKAPVSVGIMMLQEEGKLLVDDPVSRYLPEFRKTTVAVPKTGGGYDVVPATRQITIRDLLTHTAGIGYGGGPGAAAWKAAGIQGWYFADRTESVRAVVQRMAALPMDAQPGERFVYGYNTDILGAVIEVVSGMTLDEFLKTNIFEPLRMKSTSFYLDPANRKRLTTVYTSVNGKLVPSPTPGAMTGQGAYADGPRVAFSGGAGLLSTAGDYARFLQMLLNGGELDGARILAPSSVALMTTNHSDTLFTSLAPGLGFGLGFQVRLTLGSSGQPGSVGTYGWGGAYHSTYWVDPPEGLVVVYLTQLNNTGGVDDHAKIQAMIYGALVGP